MVSKKLIAVFGVAAAGAGVLDSVRRWKSNPDPLAGERPAFPDGDSIVVPTDDGAQIRVVRAGSGPNVVLVHGLTSNSDDWGPVASRLVEQGFRVIGVNQRGHGGSTVGSDGFGGRRLGLDLMQVFEALDLRDVILAGHSMGGMASMIYAVNHRVDFEARVRGLGLIATAANTSTGPAQLGLKIVAARPSPDFSESGPVLDGIGRYVARLAFGTKPSWDALGYAVATADRCPDDTRIEAAKGILDYNIEDTITGIEMPTAVVVGSLDRMTYQSVNEAIAGAVPNATLRIVSGAGHLVIWEAPEIVADEIASLATR